MIVSMLTLWRQLRLESGDNSHQKSIWLYGVAVNYVLRFPRLNPFAFLPTINFDHIVMYGREPPLSSITRRPPS